jgi:fumarate reductase subunit D
MRRLEPLWWGLFSVGGTLAAFLLPVHIFLNNVAVPLGWVSSDSIAYDNMLSLVRNPLVKLYLIVLLSSTLFLVAHRIQTLPHDFKLSLPKGPTSAVSHLVAAALSIIVIIVIVQV